MTVYGLELGGGVYRPQRDVIGAVEATPGRNIAVRLGRETRGRGWEQTGYVVLTPEEARQLAGELGKAAA